MEKVGTYKIKEPNLIGQLGEVVATYILRKLYSYPYRIVRSNTYPYYIVDPTTTERADFEIHGEKEVILVEVKTTIHKTFRISGSESRRYFQEELRLYKLHDDVTKIVILKICLGSFPNIKYSIEEINKDD